MRVTRDAIQERRAWIRRLIQRSIGPQTQSEKKSPLEAAVCMQRRRGDPYLTAGEAKAINQRHRDRDRDMLNQLLSLAPTQVLYGECAWVLDER